MIIYNVTLKVDNSIHTPWLQWMNEKHIPDVMATGCFEKYVFVKLLDTDESEGLTYAVQYYALSKAQYNRYIELHAAQLRRDATSKWGNGFVAFRTLMEVVN